MKRKFQLWIPVIILAVTYAGSACFAQQEKEDNDTHNKSVSTVHINITKKDETGKVTVIDTTFTTTDDLDSSDLIITKKYGLDWFPETYSPSGKFYQYDYKSSDTNKEDDSGDVCDCPFCRIRRAWSHLTGNNNQEKEYAFDFPQMNTMPPMPPMAPLPEEMKKGNSRIIIIIP